LTIITIPALLAASKPDNDALAVGDRLPVIEKFGTPQEKPVLESFRLRDGKKPYLAVWQEPPVFINEDYPGSTLQRQRTQDELGRDLFNIAWDADRTKRIGTALRSEAGLRLKQRGIKPVSRMSLALWLGRHEDLANPEAFLDWFDATYPLAGTDLEEFYPREIPAYLTPSQPMDSPFWTDDPPSNDDVLEALHPAVTDQAPLDVPSTTPPKVTELDGDASDNDPDDLRWTRDFCAYPLRDADVARLSAIVLAKLAAAHIELPDSDALVRRCVTALLVGHLVLQGPPGTGKTTLARILAEAFDVRLLESTATSEWSPFHVVGGLRPSSDGSLQPSYGKVADAVLKCAVQVRGEVNAEAEGSDSLPRYQGTWLLIDEFNRADIDKAIGSLYTVLSSSDPQNLLRSPIDLWFESEGRQQLWVPSRFRIIAAMNDFDTSFVNPISQGLTRRLQFVTIAAPTYDGAPDVLSPETENAFSSAYAWLSTTYGGVLALQDVDAARATSATEIQVLQTLIAGLRTPTDSTAGWPVGTAQVVDILKVLLLQVASGTASAQALDWGVADRLVPQMNQVDDAQIQLAHDLFAQAGLVGADAALQHLVEPHGT
jgi:hypothetical protein